MKRLFAAFLCALGGGLVLGAFQWPLADGDVVLSFGAPREGRLTCEIQIRGEGKVVKPADGGEVIFERRDGYEDGPLSGLGNMAVVHHMGGLRTLYAGYLPLDKGDAAGAAASGIAASAGQEVGPWRGGLQRQGGRITPFSQLGKTGKSPLRFYLYDDKKRQHVNPFLVLPPLTDKMPPVLEKLILENVEGGLYPLPSRVLPRGEYWLKSRVYDRITGAGKRLSVLPYMTALYLNGLEERTMTFDALKTLEGERVLPSPGNPGYPDVFDDEGYVILGRISLIPGRNNIEIILRDIAGNETVRSYPLEVR